MRWMSSLFIKVTFSWDYSSVSLTAATFPDKGRQTKCNITASATDQLLYCKRTVEDAGPYNKEKRTPRTRRGGVSPPVQTLTVNGIWCTKQTKRRQPKPPLCKGRCRGTRRRDCENVKLNQNNPSVIFLRKCHLPLHKGGFIVQPYRLCNRSNVV